MFQLIKINPNHRATGCVVLAVTAIAALFSECALADSVSVYTMMTNLQNSFPGIQHLINWSSYLIGVTMVFTGLYKLHHLGDSHNMMSQQHSLSGPLLLMVIGSVLIYVPSMLSNLTTTLWGTDSPLGYTVATGTQYDQMITIMMQIIKIVGVIAFIRGWILIAKATDSGQQGAIGKGITHIIGGLLAFHMDATLQVLHTTFIGS